LVRYWFETDEAPLGKRMEVFDGSGHAPFLTETDRFVETVRGFAAGIAAWCRLSRTPLAPRHVEIIRALDETFVEHFQTVRDKAPRAGASCRHGLTKS
jgi:hypothetical protein